LFDLYYISYYQSNASQVNGIPHIAAEQKL